MTNKESPYKIIPIKDLDKLLSFYGVSEKEWEEMSDTIHDQLGFILAQIKKSEEKENETN